MELQERITYDSHELIQAIERQLDQLKVFRFDSRYRGLLGEAFVAKLAEWENNIRSRKDDPFTLVVCGEFKRGKSSLINALLQDEVVTTNVTTETVTLNRISYGSHSNEALLSGGRRLKLSDEELQRERLEEVMRQTGEPVRRLELKRPLELLKYVTIIDTPGLGDSLKDFSEMVVEALHQADAVIYVFSVSYPLSQAEQLFLKTEIVPQKYTELFLAGNYTDVLGNQENYDRMQALLREKVQGLLPGQKPWMLSALDERCLQCGEDRPNEALEDLLEKNFASFRERIDRLVTEKKDLVLPDRMQRMLRGMTEELSQNLAVMEKGLEMSSQDVRTAMERVHTKSEEQIKVQAEISERISDMVKTMQAEAYEWVSGLLDRLQRETDTLSNLPAEELIKYYSFYCIDMLQEAMNRCIEYHTIAIYENLEEISLELTKGLFLHADSGYSFRFALDNRTWTKGDNVSYVISKLPVGGLISLAADGIAGAMRQKEIEKKAPDILQKIRDQYGSLRVSALKAVEDTYRQMGENVKKQLDEYYSNQILTAKEQAEQAAVMARQDETKKAEIREAISQIRVVLSGMEGALM
ncbi:dynamin family protein [Lachnospiraceae bacterium 62-35]